MIVNRDRESTTRLLSIERDLFKKENCSNMQAFIISPLPAKEVEEIKEGMVDFFGNTAGVVARTTKERSLMSDEVKSGAETRVGSIFGHCRSSEDVWLFYFSRQWTDGARGHHRMGFRRRRGEAFGRR
jgi:hypothetical protein